MVSPEPPAEPSLISHSNERARAWPLVCLSSALPNQATLKLVPAERLAAHCHDTYGQAIANILTTLQYGVATIVSGRSNH